MEKGVKIGLLYMLIGLLTGIIISLILIDNFYQKQLGVINTQYKKDMEEMIAIPEIIIMENQTCPEIKCPEIICDPCQSVPSFMSIAELNSNHEYILDEYDCTQFSDELVKDLKKEGWKAEKIIGYYYDDGENDCGDSKETHDCMHEWTILEIPIESVYGYVIEPDVYDTYYSLKRRS